MPALSAVLVAGCASQPKPIGRFEHSKGHFVKNGAIWTEHLNDASYTFAFREVKRDGTWLYLRDDARRVDMKLPLRGGEMMLTTPYYVVKPVTQ
jgi:hypothetical protein